MTHKYNKNQEKKKEKQIKKSKNAICTTPYTNAVISMMHQKIALPYHTGDTHTQHTKVVHMRTQKKKRYYHNNK